MSRLVLTNGKSFEFTESSTIYNLTTVVATFAEIDPIRVELTASNLDEATFNDEPVGNIVPDGINIEAATGTDPIVVHFINRDKRADEIRDDEQDAVINMLLGL